MALNRFQQVLVVTNYNGYQFPAPETVETVAYKVTPRWDASGRTITSCLFEMTLQWHIASVDGTDDEVQDMVYRLTRPAGILKYLGRGFGVGEEVNEGEVKDVNWGPKPGPVELYPIGNGLTLRARWSVSFEIPTCPDAIFRQAIREFGYALDFTTDRSGLTTRTYRAHVSIAVTRLSAESRVVPDSADRLREEIYPSLALGFRREREQWSLSEDKSTGEMTVVDVQLPALAPPPGCVDAQVEHNYKLIPNTLVKWQGTFSATYEIARSPTTANDTVGAIQDFLLKVSLRLLEVSKMIRGKGVTPVAPGGGAPPFLIEAGVLAGVDFGPLVAAVGGGVVPDAGKPIGFKGIIPVSWDISEPNVYGKRQVRITMTYSIAGMGVSEILEKGGLWKPWGHNYDLWQKSVPTLNRARGEALLVFRPADETIIDLCRPAPGINIPWGFAGLATGAVGAIPAGGAAAIAVGGAGIGAVPAAPGAAGAVIGGVGGAGAGALGATGTFGELVGKMFPPPSPAASWIDYQNGVVIRTETGRVVGTTLPTTPIGTGHTNPNWDAMKDSPGNQTPHGSPFPPLSDQLRGTQEGSATFVHQRTRPILYITLAGYAVRVGYPIPVPELVQVNGATPVLVGSPVFAQAIVGNAQVPIYGARWQLTYVCPEGNVPTGAIPVPPNPYLA